MYLFPKFESKLYDSKYNFKFKEMNVIKTTFLRCVFIRQKKTSPYHALKYTLKQRKSRKGVYLHFMNSKVNIFFKKRFYARK